MLVSYQDSKLENLIGHVVFQKASAECPLFERKTKPEERTAQLHSFLGGWEWILYFVLLSMMGYINYRTVETHTIHGTNGIFTCMNG